MVGGVRAGTGAFESLREKPGQEGGMRLGPLGPPPGFGAGTGQAVPWADSNHMLEEELCALLCGPRGLAFLGLSQPIFLA